MKLTHEQDRILKYIRHYPEWVDTIETMSTARAIAYDSDKVQTSPQDMMIQMAIQIEDYEERIRKVEKCLAYVFLTDQAIIRARKAYCYGILKDMTKYEYYSHRRLLAVCLLEVFKDEYENQEG